MASILGGPSDKLGNEFERLWTVRLLLELLSRQALSVQIERLGPDERGVEFWVQRQSGTREGHQCKRENASCGRWTVAQLAAKGVIANARYQLDRDPSHRFFFVSGDKATHLSDLAERARQYGDVEEFHRYAVPTSGEHAREFENLCRHLELDAGRKADLAQAVDFLRRFHPVLIDKEMLRADVEERAARWVAGDTGQRSVEVLEGLVLASAGKTLDEAKVVDHIRRAKLRLCDLARDPYLSDGLAELRARFDRSYRHLLIGQTTLGRQETADLYRAVTTPGGPRLIVVHGPAGTGKSGVVFELVDLLSRDSISYLPLRLDLDTPGSTPEQFGRQLGLPSSPVTCLLAAAAGRPAVLLLDQLDAIRWTSAHSANAWDTCERLIDHALRHDNVRVLVACRTFDLHEDGRLRPWRQRHHPTEIIVGRVAADVVARLVAATGVKASDLTDQQRAVLASPQALYLWLSLYRAEKSVPTFRTMTDLMRAFWESVRRSLARLLPGEYDRVLEVAVDHMDTQGVLHLPRSLVSRWPHEVSALISINVFTDSTPARLLFAHQSYFDHLVAERVLSQIHSGRQAVVDWVKGHEQSLFRRGQLRQLLTLLRDEDPGRYGEAMSDLLWNQGVRFHLRHLALQMLGHADPPTEDEIALTLSLLEDPNWVDHVLIQVLLGRLAWFDVLYERGLLLDWIKRPAEEWRYRIAICLAEGVINNRGNAVTALLHPTQDDDGDRQRLEAVLWRAELPTLPDSLFDAYVRLASAGSGISDYIDWKKLAEGAPRRAITLLLACLSRQLSQDAPQGESWAERNGITGKEVLLALANAARVTPAEAWDGLCACAMTVFRPAKRSGMLDGRDALARRIHLRCLTGRLLMAAGKAFAKQSPHGFWKRVQAVGNDEPRAVSRILCSCIAAGPDLWAERAMRWLMTRTKRLVCGTHRGASSHGGSRYSPARRVLRRFGQLCSNSTIRALEEAFRRHKPSWELFNFRSCHQLFMGTSFWGPQHRGWIRVRSLFVGQYLLLSALPTKRLTADTRDWLGVLREKFGPAANLTRAGSRHMGGFVRSTIPPDRVHLISDRQWLRIVRTDWSRKQYRWKQLGPGVLGETKPETFAGDLNSMTRRQPQRFCRLAMRFPAEVDRRYVIAVMRGVAEETPPPGVTEAAQWSPASVEEIESVLARFAFLASDREFVAALTWLIRKRSTEAWTAESFRLLTSIALRHPDPREEAQAETTAASGEGNIVSAAINCARGQAADAIEAVLYHHLDRLDEFELAVESLVRDPHVAVRVAAVGIAIPLLNLNRDKAVATLLRACDHPNDQVLLSPELDRFFGYALLDRLGELEPLVRRMIRSTIGEVAKRGAAWATGVWLHVGKMADATKACATGTPALRRGVADMLARELARGRGGHEAEDQLISFFDDEDQEVRREAASVFRAEGEFFGTPLAVRVAHAFTSSEAFDDDSSSFLYGMREAKTTLVRFDKVLLQIVNAFASASTEKRDVRARGPLDASMLSRLLLVLYDQSERDPSVRQTCLDAWDHLLKERIGYDILQHLDA